MSGRPSDHGRNEEKKGKTSQLDDSSENGENSGEAEHNPERQKPSTVKTCTLFRSSAPGESRMDFYLEEETLGKAKALFQDEEQAVLRRALRIGVWSTYLDTGKRFEQK